MAPANGATLANEDASNASVQTFTRDPTIKRRWILNAFDMACTGHISPGSWKRDGDRSAEYNTIKYWTDLAQLLERGKFQGLL